MDGPRPEETLRQIAREPLHDRDRPNGRDEPGCEVRRDDGPSGSSGNATRGRPILIEETSQVVISSSSGRLGRQISVVPIPEEELVGSLTRDDETRGRAFECERHRDLHGALRGGKPLDQIPEGAHGRFDVGWVDRAHPQGKAEAYRARPGRIEVRGTEPPDGDQLQSGRLAELPGEQRGVEPAGEQERARRRGAPIRAERVLERRVQLRKMARRVRHASAETARPRRTVAPRCAGASFGIGPDALRPRQRLRPAALGSSVSGAPGSPPAPTAPRRALFVDRDGTLNPDLRYLKDSARLELRRGVGNAIRLAHDHGFLVLCVTNQSGVDRGFYSREDVETIHARLNELLRPSRTRIDAFYYCPHAPDAGCACRKPRTQLFEDARTDWNIEFATSAIVGDRALDIEAGRTLGLLTALAVPPNRVASTLAELEQHGVVADLIAPSFESAVLRILSRG